jgi:RHS repeat-associated protein
MKKTILALVILLLMISPSYAGYSKYIPIPQSAATSPTPLIPLPPGNVTTKGGRILSPGPPSSNPWGAPGVSPFESYFSSLSEYVNPGNGELTVVQTDLSIPGRGGLDLAISRVFSAPNLYTAGNKSESYDNYTLANLGLGWSFDFPWLGTNYLHMFDGEEYNYVWNGNTFENHNQTNFKLVNNTNSYDLYLASGVDYHYNSAKQLVTIIDTTGNNTITFYYKNNEISSIIDDIGRNVTFSYNSQNQISNMSYDGKTWAYGYTGSDLTSMTDPLNLITQFQYNTGINSWLLGGIIYATGGESSYSYGHALIGSTYRYYVTLQNAYSAATALVRSTSFTLTVLTATGSVLYNIALTSNGTSIQREDDYNFTNPAKSVQTVKDGSGNVMESTDNNYDTLGRIVSTQTYSPSSTLISSTNSSYDNWGNVIYSLNANGHPSWFSYSNTNTSNIFLSGAPSCSNCFYTNNSISSNIHDLLLGDIETQNGTGSPSMGTFYDYASSGELLHQAEMHSGGFIISSYAYDSYGNVIRETDPLGRTTFDQYSSTYDYAYLTQSSIIVGGKNVSMSYTYDFPTGLELSVTDPNGFTTYYSYDKLNRIKTETYPAVNGQTAVTQYTYIDSNDHITITDPNGNVAKQYYDGLGRSVEYQRFNQTGSYSKETATYNWQNQIATETTATGKTYTYYYDALGRSIETVNPDGTSSFTSYVLGSISTKTVTDANGHNTTYGYDTLGQLIYVKEYYSPSAYYLTSYSYNQVGNLTKLTDANNHVTTYQYDDLGRLINTTYPDGTSQSQTYDSVGNMITKTDPMKNTITYAYDSLNRLINVTYPDNSFVHYAYDNDGNVLSIINSNSSIFYTYDARDRVTNSTEVINGTAYTVLYNQYDKDGNILSMIYPDGNYLNFTYDSENRLTSLGDSATFTYTKNDKISTITYGNGLVTTYTYDSLDRIKSIVSTSGSSTLLSLHYTYDNVGNVISIGTEKYTYDSLNRLSSTSGPWGIINYTYDGAGNMLSMKQGSSITNYTYDNYNRMLTSGNANLTYNANGDLVKLVNGSNTWQYFYDYENRLTSASLNSQSVEKNAYDGQNNRIEMTLGNSSIAYVYQQGNIWEQKNLTSGVVTNRDYANGLQVEDIVTNTWSQYYYQEDALGSTRLVTGNSANIIFQSDYKPYGLNFAPSGVETFMYTGKPDDSAIGLYYYGARFYDPSIGRFITEDAVTGSLDSPLSLNRYSYTEDNPMTFNDPSGNVIAIPGGGVISYIPHPPPPAPPPTVQPSYEKATRNALVPGTSPNPPPPVSGQTQPQPLSIGYWFVQDFLIVPEHVEQLASLTVGFTLLVVPDLDLVSRMMNMAFYGAITNLISGGFDFAALANDASHGNTGAFVQDIVGLAADSLNVFLQSLNFWAVAANWSTSPSSGWS